MLLGLAYSILGNREDAEDVVQDVCARLLSKPLPLSLSRNPEAFAARAVMNACVDLIRRRKYQVDVPNVPEPVSAQENSEDMELVRKAMSHLPDRQPRVPGRDAVKALPVFENVNKNQGLLAAAYERPTLDEIFEKYMNPNFKQLEKSIGKDEIPHLSKIEQTG